MSWYGMVCTCMLHTCMLSSMLVILKPLFQETTDAELWFQLFLRTCWPPSGALLAFAEGTTTPVGIDWRARMQVRMESTPTIVVDMGRGYTKYTVVHGVRGRHLVYKCIRSTTWKHNIRNIRTLFLGGGHFGWKMRRCEDFLFHFIWWCLMYQQVFSSTKVGSWMEKHHNLYNSVPLQLIHQTAIATNNSATSTIAWTVPS